MCAATADEGGNLPEDGAGAEEEWSLWRLERSLEAWH